MSRSAAARCSVCRAEAEPAYSIQHSKCQHWTHADCELAGTPLDFKQCPACLRQIETPAVREPRTTDGIDYILNPGAPPRPSVLERVRSALVPYGAGVRKPETVLLLEKRTPVDELIETHGYGLEHMLRDGVHIEQYLANGYGLQDLARYEDISRKGPLRSLQAFTHGLGLTAAHLRDYPDRLPIDEFKALTKITPSNMNRLLGLQFPPDGPLECYGDMDWSAQDCVNLGLNMDNLIRDLGMHRIEQYEDLMSGLTEAEATDAERALGVTEKQLMQLVAASEPPEAPAAPREPRRHQPSTTQKQESIEARKGSTGGGGGGSHRRNEQRRPRPNGGGAAVGAPATKTAAPISAVQPSARFARLGFKG